MNIWDLIRNPEDYKVEHNSWYLESHISQEKTGW